MSASNDQTIAAYNAGVDTYVAHLKPIDGDLKQWIDALLDSLNPPAKILEIGSGDGRDANYIEALGYHVERTDGAKEFVNMQREQGKRAHVLNLLTDELSGAYNLVFANAVFLHFNKQEFQAALHKVYNALQAGGRFGLTLKRGDGEEVTSQKMNAPRYFKFWQLDDIKHTLQTGGFTIISADTHADWRPNKPDWLFIIAVKESES